MPDSFEAIRDPDGRLLMRYDRRTGRIEYRRHGSTYVIDLRADGPAVVLLVDNRVDNRRNISTKDSDSAILK